MDDPELLIYAEGILYLVNSAQIGRVNCLFTVHILYFLESEIVWNKSPKQLTPHYDQFP